MRGERPSSASGGKRGPVRMLTLWCRSCRIRPTMASNHGIRLARLCRDPRLSHFARAGGYYYCQTLPNTTYEQTMLDVKEYEIDQVWWRGDEIEQY